MALFQVACCRKRLVANAGQDDGADAIASNQIVKTLTRSRLVWVLMQFMAAGRLNAT
jgi:hypothetical protein